MSAAPLARLVAEGEALALDSLGAGRIGLSLALDPAAPQTRALLSEIDRAERAALRAARLAQGRAPLSMRRALPPCRLRRSLCAEAPMLRIVGPAAALRPRGALRSGGAARCRIAVWPAALPAAGIVALEFRLLAAGPIDAQA